MLPKGQTVPRHLKTVCKGVFHESNPNAIRATLKKTLNVYGVGRFSLFQGLDSLAAHIEWLQSQGF